MINLILADTRRSLEYLKILSKNKLTIDNILIYSKKNNFQILKKIKNLNYQKKIIKLKIQDVNKIKLSSLRKIKDKNFNILSAYPGEIVNNNKLLKKNLIHCHPGDLPNFKGSTTIYYSLILKKRICVTLFIMNSKIDSGKILFKKKFSIPKNIRSIEENYDSVIRAKTLFNYLISNKKKKYKNKNKKSLPYYIAHPIIRQIILNKKILKNIFDK